MRNGPTLSPARKTSSSELLDEDSFSTVSPIKIDRVELPMTGGSCVLHLCIKKQDVVDLTDQMVRMKAETHHELDYGTDVSDFACFPDIAGLLSEALQKQNFIIHSNFHGVGVQLSSSGSLSWNTRLSPGNKCTSVCGHVWNRSVHYSQVGSFENSARHLRYESTSFKRKSQRC